MKKVSILAAFCAFLPFIASAAEVRGARVNANDATLRVDITYAGGCGNKTFTLEVGKAWAYSDPTQGSAKIIESGSDSCEAYISKTLVFSLKREGLARPELRAASLTIYGDNNSSAEVTLPYQL